MFTDEITSELVDQICLNLLNLDELIDKSKNLFEDDLSGEIDENIDFEVSKADEENYNQLNSIDDPFDDYSQLNSMHNDLIDHDSMIGHSALQNVNSIYNDSIIPSDSTILNREPIIGSDEFTVKSNNNSTTNPTGAVLIELSAKSDNEHFNGLLTKSSSVDSAIERSVLYDDLALSDDDDDDAMLVDNHNQRLTYDKSSLKDIYKAEKLLAKREKKKGKFEYLVKYENLDDDQLIWESEKTLDKQLVEEFNRKYGDKLLLEDIDKQTYSKYFDKRFEDVAIEDANNEELDELIRKSINNPLCNVCKNVKPERIIGLYKFNEKFYYLIKWNKSSKADLYECESFKKSFPDIVIEYYESKMMFNDLEEKRCSDDLVESRRVYLKKDESLKDLLKDF